MISTGDTFYHYDNEAIGCFIISELLKEVGRISIAKALMILPLFLHDPIVQRFKNNVKYRSIDEFIIKERLTIGDFNLRLQNLLPITFNSISLLVDMQLLKLEGTDLSLKISNNIFSGNDSGKRAEMVRKIIPKATFLFREDDESTYLKFNISI